MDEKNPKETVISVAEMRARDAATIAGGVPSRVLMQRAGEAMFEAGKWQAPVAVVCGKGNNAGDGFVVAELLKNAGIACTIFLLYDSFSEDGAYFHEKCLEAGVQCLKLTENADVYATLKPYNSIMDCIFGTGFRGEVTGLAKTVIEAINTRHGEGAYVLSADINSGLNGDTGEGEICVESDLTVSVGFFQPGHFIGKAGLVMKDKINANIGIR